MCNNIKNKVNLSNFVGKPWVVVACNSFEAERDLNNIRAAFETKKEAENVLTEYILEYSRVRIVNIVEYINKTFGE